MYMVTSFLTAVIISRFKSDKPRSGESPNAQGFSNLSSDQTNQHLKFLGDASQAIPELDPISYSEEDDPMPDNITPVK